MLLYFAREPTFFIGERMERKDFLNSFKFLPLLLFGCNTENILEPKTEIPKVVRLFKDNAIQVSIFTTVAVSGSLNGIISNPSGITQSLNRNFTVLTANADGTKQTFVYPLGDMNGWEIQFLALSLTTTNIQRGQCYARIEILDTVNSVSVCILAAHYLTSNNVVSYPGTGIEDSTNGAGYQKKIQLDTTFDLSLKISVTVPDNVMWRFQYGACPLKTSNVAGNRQFLFFTFGYSSGNTFLNHWFPTQQADSLTYQYYVESTGNVPAIYTDPNFCKHQTILVPDNIFLLPNMVLGFWDLGTADGGDLPICSLSGNAYNTRGFISVEEWIKT